MIGYLFIPFKQGLITYNNHVVGNAKTVAVTFVDGNTYTAKVVGTRSYIEIYAILEPRKILLFVMELSSTLWPVISPFDSSIRAKSVYSKSTASKIKSIFLFPI